MRSGTPRDFIYNLPAITYDFDSFLSTDGMTFGLTLALKIFFDDFVFYVHFSFFYVITTDVEEFDGFMKQL